MSSRGYPPADAHDPSGFASRAYHARCTVGIQDIRTGGVRLDRKFGDCLQAGNVESRKNTRRGLYLPRNRAGEPSTPAGGCSTEN